ncbi:hypothetical protein RF11_11317 [Thelohanellus kitauei]|uniref:BPTI/Kunitz inhibitor domain-containing protein n=1 Tax=Thelohanellus kitauei TaxID=669202 RepID=A0A0C2IWH8_THEKT|nr:hypothetical protein RF11_11317 [Thelohanellus kitauei]
MNIIFVPSKCYEARHEGDCKSHPKSTYFYFDIQQGSCLKYQACGHPLAELNMFWSLGDCRAECASPHSVKNIETKRTKKAFNKWRGSCESYIKRKGYPTPPLFNNYDECDEYCLIDP